MDVLRRTLTVLLLAGFASCPQAHAQTDEEDKLADAVLVLEEMGRDPATAIPPLLLANAQGVAVIPNVIRAGFILGGHRGKGVVVVRSDNGEWSNPAFITLTGGSIGAQIGAESSDIVLVFGNQRSVRNIGSGKFTLGSEASVTAGPVERGTGSATDMTFTAEVYAYSRSRGLFAGATVEGARLSMDALANDDFYPQGSGAEPLAPQSLSTPAGARRFLLSLEQSEAAPGRSPRSSAEEVPAQEEAVTYPLGGGPD